MSETSLLRWYLPLSLQVFASIEKKYISLCWDFAEHSKKEPSLVNIFSFSPNISPNAIAVVAFGLLSSIKLSKLTKYFISKQVTIFPFYDMCPYSSKSLP